MPQGGAPARRSRWQRLSGRDKDRARQSEDNQMSSRYLDPVQISLD